MDPAEKTEKGAPVMSYERMIEKVHKNIKGYSKNQR